MNRRPAARLVRRNYGSGHGYRLDGEKVPGVTTVLKAKAAPALVTWAGNTVAEHAVDHWDELAGMTPSARLSRLKAAPNASRNRAAVRGTRIHALAEQLQASPDVEVADDLRGPVEAVARFLDLWQIEPVAVELVVAHTGFRYAGTSDLFGESPLLGRFLLDWKTGKGVYSEAALQLAAYRFADLATDGERDLVVPEVENVLVAHVLSDTVELHPVVADQSTWRAFLHILSVHRWVEAEKEDGVVGRPIQPETAREALS